MGLLQSMLAIVLANLVRWGPEAMRPVRRAGESGRARGRRTHYTPCARNSLSIQELCAGVHQSEMGALRASVHWLGRQHGYGDDTRDVHPDRHDWGGRVGL